VARTPKLTHLDRGGAAHMVDVSAKAATERVAVAID
jgi:molybdenum cofactor biosynthesis enzyme